MIVRYLIFFKNIHNSIVLLFFFYNYNIYSHIPYIPTIFITMSIRGLQNGDRIKSIIHETTQSNGSQKESCRRRTTCVRINIKAYTHGHTRNQIKMKWAKTRCHCDHKFRTLYRAPWTEYLYM